MFGHVSSEWIGRYDVDMDSIPAHVTLHSLLACCSITLDIGHSQRNNVNSHVKL